MATLRAAQRGEHGGHRLLLLLLVAALFSCAGGEAATSMSTLLPYLDDLVLVHDAIVARVNDARTEQGGVLLVWDEDLQELAEGQAWEIVKGDLVFERIAGLPAYRLGEPVIELRACLSDNATTPDVVAKAAVDEWLAELALRQMLLGNWTRIGVGYDWGVRWIGAWCWSCCWLAECGVERTRGGLAKIEVPVCLVKPTGAESKNTQGRA